MRLSSGGGTGMAGCSAADETGGVATCATSCCCDGDRMSKNRKKAPKRPSKTWREVKKDMRQTPRIGGEIVRRC